MEEIIKQLKEVDRILTTTRKDVAGLSGFQSKLRELIHEGLILKGLEEYGSPIEETLLITPIAKDVFKKKIPDCVEDCYEVMIEFAKIHVTQALKEAAQKAETKTISDKSIAQITPHYQTENGLFIIIDKDSILNSYSLDNIK